MSNLDCETICVDHGSVENGRSLIQRREIVSEGKLSDIESITRSELYGLKKRADSTTESKSRCSFPYVWALCTTVLFLVVSIVGIVTFVQISAEMDELREQFTVGATLYVTAWIPRFHVLFMAISAVFWRFWS